MSDLDAFLDAEMARGVQRLRERKPRVAKAPRTKPGTPERDAQKAVVAWLTKAGCLVEASVNEAAASSADPDKRARFHMARKRAGVLKGWPDLTVITPGGRVFWVEMKSAKGRTTAAQDALHADMRSRGCIVLVARDIWGLQAELAQAGISLTRTPLRRATPVEPLVGGDHG